MGVKKFGESGAPPPGVEALLTPKNTSLPHVCHDAKFGCSRSNCMCVHRRYQKFGVKRYERYNGDLSENFDPLHPTFNGHSRSFKPTQINEPPVTSCVELWNYFVIFRRFTAIFVENCAFSQPPCI